MTLPTVRPPHNDSTALSPRDQDRIETMASSGGAASSPPPIDRLWEACVDAIEEESQVVPASLDHLSRDELCRMIFRLDYERSTLKDRLGALQSHLKRRRENQLRLIQAGASIDQSRNCHAPPSPTRGGRKRQRTRPQRPRRGTALPTATAEPERRTATFAPGTECPAEPAPPPEEVERLRTQLGKRLHIAVRSAVHGGLKVPKSSITENDISLPMTAALMNDFKEYKTSETNRMTRWLISDDRVISRALSCERLVHPVQHDGTGHVLPAGSSPSNVYYWAQFVSLGVRYDKREQLITVAAKTKVAGNGRPEHMSERIAYSRGSV
ncbi:hypothetical protein ACHAWF_006644 [Thalassiosira exigua]